ncbi:heme oxygenase-like protein [Sporormia fimetaria CBS 119925]|uniref:Heme oxygenase-like protein n=1 Tax=Sporormia fimetaria CBS 119925 TaxID=1340428 RepID=A0A6A6VGY7_9PLEO|nr:heme oxygenase-like protein [Sporormia fimetaria CBS 119925]
MGRHANPDIRRAFVEFQDPDTPSKCNKVRCLHCGFVRAKNTTRQIEHLLECSEYQALPEVQQQTQLLAAANGSGNSGILNGQHPNPNLQVQRRGPNQKRNREGNFIPQHPSPLNPAPSLTAHLLAICHEPFARATQQRFLSHAGCGSLAAGPLSQWLAQDGHYARGYIRFVGHLLSKIRLPQTSNSQFHPMYRTMDLLISALNNMRREMQFFEITATKYGITPPQDLPTPITRCLLDLFVSASSSSASLLEGMVVLWGSEHFYRSSWQYASSFQTSMSTPSTETHIVALHQALIPNWTSPAFSKFVDATRALVDEHANITTARDGKEEMLRCEEIFRQICWIGERFWPDVDGMGEEDENAAMSMGGNVPGMDNSLNDPGMNGPGMSGPGMNGPNMNGPNMTPSSMGGHTQGLNNQGMSTQGISTQGMSTQGMSTQGMSTQGMSTQGMSTQGMSTQGMSTQGLNTQGMNAQGMTGGDGTPVSASRDSFSGLDGVSQST